MIEGKLVCNFASLEHTRLVHISDVMPGKSPHLYQCVYSVSAVLELLVSGKVELSLPRTSTELPLSSQSLCSAFVFQREQRAFCGDGSLVFESPVRYSGSLFSTMACWFVPMHVSAKHRTLYTDIYILLFSFFFFQNTDIPHSVRLLKKTYNQIENWNFSPN